MKRTTVFTMLLLSVLVLLVDTSIAHITVADDTAVIPYARVSRVEQGDEIKIQTATSVSVKTGPHGASEQHEHAYLIVEHQVITDADDSSIVHLFQYWMKGGTFVGSGQKSEGRPRRRTVTDGAKWGLAWASGEVSSVYQMASHTGVAHPNNQAMVNNGIPEEVGVVSGLIPLQPIAPDSSSRAAIEQELADALAANSDASVAVNYNGRIYTFGEDEEPVFDGTGALSTVTESVALPAAPPRPEPRIGTLTTTWASMKNG